MVGCKFDDLFRICEMVWYEILVLWVIFWMLGVCVMFGLVFIGFDFGGEIVCMCMFICEC